MTINAIFASVLPQQDAVIRMASPPKFDSANRRKRVTALAQAIVQVCRERRDFTTDDALRAGFGDDELRRLWADAVREAIRIEPGIGTWMERP